MNRRAQLNKLNTSGWSDSYFCSLLSLCAAYGSDSNIPDEQQADDFLTTIEWALDKGVNPASLLSVLYVFYFGNVLEPDYKKTFYKLFLDRLKLPPEYDQLSRLYQMAHFTLIGEKSVVDTNLLGKRVEESNGIISYNSDEDDAEILFTLEYQTWYGEKVKKIIAPELIPIEVLVDNWSYYFELFGFDFITILDICDLDAAQKALVNIKDQLQNTPSETLMRITNLPPESRDNLLTAMGYYYFNQAQQQDYVKLLTACPAYLKLITYVSMNNAVMKKIIKRISLNLIKNFFISLSPNIDGLYYGSKSYKMLADRLKDNPQADFEIRSILVSKLLSLENDNGYHYLQEDLLIALRDCNLLPIVKKELQIQLAALKEASTKRYADVLDLWNSYEVKRSIIKNVFPHIRFSEYPYNSHECMAFYLEECYLHNPKGFPEVAWSHITSDIVQPDEKHREAILLQYKRKALAQAFVITKNSAFREQLIILLQNENKEWYCSKDFWSELTPTVIYALYYRNNIEALKILKEYISDKIISKNTNYNDIIHKLCQLNLIENTKTLIMSEAKDKLNAKSIERALSFMAKNGQWDIVQMILNMTEKNGPDVSDVTNTLTLAIKTKQLNIVTLILKKFENQINLLYLEIILQAVIDTNQLNIMRMMLNISGKIKLIQEDIKFILKNATISNKFDIIKLILEQCETQIDPETIKSVLNNMILKAQSDIVQIILNMTGKNKPDIETINSALKTAIRIGQNDIVLMIFKKFEKQIPHNKSDACNILKIATKANQWNIVAIILDVTGKDSFDTDVIEDLLIKAAKIGQNNTVKIILDKFKDELTKSEVQFALENAIKMDQEKTTQVILKIASELSLSKSGLNRILKSAVEEQRWNIVRIFLNITGAYKLNDTTVDDIQLKAVEAGQNDIVQLILKQREKEITANTKSIQANLWSEEKTVEPSSASSASNKKPTS